MSLAIDREDNLGLLDEQLAIVSAGASLIPLAVPAEIAHRRVEASPSNEAGGVNVLSFAGDRIERLTAYRFHRRDVLNEHLFHVWPGPQHEFPALTTVIFEMPTMAILGADFVPIADVAFDPTYYARYLGDFSDLVAAHWSELVARRLGPEPPPDPYFTHQLGSRVSLLMYLEESAVDVARSFIVEATELWTSMYAGAEAAPELRAERVEERRNALMRMAYKGLDYHSPASEGLASVLGWQGANLLFDAVFGPDDVSQPLDRRRTYLDVALSPGTAGRARSTTA